MDKRIDILLSQADFLKLTTIGFFGVFLLELIEKGFAEQPNVQPDLYKLFGGLFLGAVSGIGMLVCWFKAKKLASTTK